MPGRKLLPRDALYRAVFPGMYAAGKPLPTAFEDTGGRRGERAESISFSAESPPAALRAISNRGVVKRDCGTGKRPPTPQELYAAGYRVSRTPASAVLAAAGVQNSPISLEQDPDGHEVAANGHVGVRNGDRLKATWAAISRILSEEETISG